MLRVPCRAAAAGTCQRIGKERTGLVALAAAGQDRSIRGQRPALCQRHRNIPQEMAVARLARVGRTNQQISRELYLSVNTVETHLAHVYRKLGIRRRRELADRELD